MTTEQTKSPRFYATEDGHILLEAPNRVAPGYIADVYMPENRPYVVTALNLATDLATVTKWCAENQAHVEIDNVVIAGGDYFYVAIYRLQTHLHETDSFLHVAQAIEEAAAWVRQQG